MNKETYNILYAIAYGKPFEVRPALQKYLSTVTISEKEEVKGTRTGTQNKALWLYFQKVADALIEKGVSMRKIFESTKDFDIPPTKNSVHDLWIYFQEIMYKTDSTTKLNKIEQIDKIHEILMYNLGEKFHIDYIDFPHDKMKQKEAISGVKIAQHNNLSNNNYPEYHGAPTI